MIDNMSGIDRIIRIIIGLVIVVLYLFKQISGTAAIILGIISVYFIITGFIGYDPIYHTLGISTKLKKG